MGRVSGKVALVTGAARGQGRSHAVRLAEEGADVIAVDVCRQIEGVVYPMSTPSDLRETVAMVERLGRRIVASEVDVRDLARLTAAVDEGVEILGGLDIVAASAGIGPPKLNALEISSIQWQTMIDTNLTGVWNTARAAIPHLIRAEGGAIVITGSVASLRAYQNMAHYVSAKHGLIGLSKALALELAPHMIRVNTVHPTGVRTPMLLNEANFRYFCPDLDEPTEADFTPVVQSLNVMPVPFVEPVDISNALVFLASEEARYITGAALPVDLGSCIR
jgi:(+)-trans-carveol dehydrogenase